MEACRESRHTLARAKALGVIVGGVDFLTKLDRASRLAQKSKKTVPKDEYEFLLDPQDQIIDTQPGAESAAASSSPSQFTSRTEQSYKSRSVLTEKREAMTVLDYLDDIVTAWKKKGEERKWYFCRHCPVGSPASRVGFPGNPIQTADAREFQHACSGYQDATVTVGAFREIRSRKPAACPGGHDKNENCILSWEEAVVSGMVEECDALELEMYLEENC